MKKRLLAISVLLMSLVSCNVNTSSSSSSASNTSSSISSSSNISSSSSSTISSTTIAPSSSSSSTSNISSSISSSSSSSSGISGGLNISNKAGNYYSSINFNTTPSNVKASLSKLISSNFNSISYDGLKSAFKETDTKDDRTIWDMYSNYNWNTSKVCGNYGKEGDCYNREHSVPKSWFQEAKPAYSDLFHLYPTDGYVNGRRSNYAYGEVANAKYTSNNGSKLGNGVEKYGTDKEIIVFMHYPPITKAKILSGEEMQFINLMKKYNVKRCYYGHLHGASIKDAIEGEVEGIQFKLISADGLDFKLEKIK